jgi:DNA-binding IclR family transcriptional regulator
LVSAVSWSLSTAAGLLGAIVTEGLLRRASESGELRVPLASWRLGLLGVAPAWLIALVGQAVKAISG